MYNLGVIALASGLVAQIAKVLIELIRHQRWRPMLVFASGGMPSSHTATVTTLTLLVSAREGVASPLFSVVLVFSLYVIFEATGLRQEVGKQAALLNELVENVRTTRQFEYRRLRELVGHTWHEVGGGICSGVFFYLVISKAGYY